MSNYKITDTTYQKFKKHIIGFWLVQAIVLFGLNVLATKIILPGSDPFNLVNFFQYFIQWTVWILFTLYIFRRSLFDYSTSNAWGWKWVLRNIYYLPLIVSISFLAEFAYSQAIGLLGMGTAISLPDLGSMYLLQSGTFLMKYFSIIAFSQAVCYLYYIKEREVEKGRMEKEYSDLKFQFLSMQIKPHFIFNAQHTILSLIETGDNKQASAMMVRLSSLLRNVLNYSEAATITLEEELSNLKNYIALQQVRFGDAIKVNFRVAEQAKRLPLPPLLLQPLVENCFQHAFAQLQEGTITVSAYLHEAYCIILVTDNGMGFNPEIIRPTSHGTRNVRRRLENAYGRDDLFVVESSSAGTAVTIKIPHAAFGC